MYYTFWMFMKRKPRENIQVCHNVSPTSYRQVTDILPTHYQLSPDCRWAVGRQVAYISGKICWPSDGRLSANSRPTVCRHTADSRPTVGRLSVDRRPTVDRQSTDRFFGEVFFTITDTRKPSLQIITKVTSWIASR